MTIGWLSWAAALLLWAAQDRTPVPDAAAQKDTLKKIRDLFKSDYAKKSPADQLALGQKLLQSGIETADDPAAKFVLLHEASELAVAAGDPETALRALEETAKSFAVDGPALKLAALGKLTLKEPEAARASAKAYLALVADAARNENFEVATTAAGRAEAAAKIAVDATLTARAGEMKSEVASLKAEANRVKPLLEKPGPNDAETIGRYLCFAKGDWESGLPHLIAGAKGPLKAIADKEAEKPQEPAPQVGLADLWWEFAQKEKSPWRKDRMMARSSYWLDLATPGATGLLKIRIQRRLDDLEALQPGLVNLLKLVDPQKDALAGTWKLEDGKLVSSAGKFVRLEFPYQPPAEYDFRVVYAPLSGGNVSQIVSHQGKGFLWIMEMGLSRCGLGMCRNCWITDATNPSRVEVQSKLNDPSPHTSLLQIRKDRVRAYLDGKLVLDYKTDYSDLAMNGDWKLRTEQLLGLGCWESPTEFQRVDLTELTGKGKKTR